MQKHTRVHAGSHDSADGSDPEFSSKTETREEGGEVEEINDKLDGKEDEHTDIIEEYRIALKKFMALSLFGRMYENILMLTAVFSCCQYIYSTYSQYIPESILADFSSLEIALAIVFTMDWCLNYFLADHKLMYFTDFYSMIDLLTVIPIWVIRAYPCMDYNAIVSSQDQIVYILCAITCTRILRSLRIRRKLMRIEDEVSRCIADIGLNIVVCLLFFAALMQFLESQDQAYEFHTWMYYILVTMATVGYGDIAPKSTLGRFMAMGMIAFAFISGPQMSSELLSKINEQSVYARAIYVKKYRSTHIYVCGEVSSMAVMEFVQELFHEDHEDENIQAVIMSPNAPTPTILHILRDPSLSLRVTYLEGSALSEKDLKRAMVREARAIFIMTNKFAEDPDQEDAKTILQQFCLKKFVMRERSSVKPLFAIQLIRPENRRHLVDSSSIEGEKPKEDIVLCLNEIKMGIIAKAVMFPGSNTLLMNLLTSFADDDDDDADAEEAEKETENLDNVEADNWVGEYQKGCGWEIYTTKLNPMFSGLAFALLADILYARCGIVMFALLIKDSARSRMLLNPADFVIPPFSEDVEVEVFVVAENKNQSDLTFPNTGGDSDDSSNGAIQMARAAASLGVSFGNVSVWCAEGNKIKAKAAELSSKYGTAYAPQSKQKEAAAPKLQEWQQLLRKYDLGSESMSSQQELEKRLDEEYMKANFYTTIPLQPKLEDCTIHTSLEVEAPYVNQHTLIVGKKLSNLYDLILPLRACYLGFTRPVVILSPNPISKAIWSRISVFQGVFFIQGSILEELDIVRAGIFKASQCIVLADTEGNVQEAGLTAGAAATQAALQDSDAVFAYQAIKNMNPNISCCIEIINAANCAFLDPKEGLVSGDVDYKFTPQFASGVLLTSSLLDTLICQVSSLLFSPLFSSFLLTSPHLSSPLLTSPLLSLTFPLHYIAPSIHHTQPR